MNDKDRKRLSEIIGAMHMITNPGEYGLGNEPESIPHDNEKAWEKLGELVEEAMAISSLHPDLDDR